MMIDDYLMMIFLSKPNDPETFDHDIFWHMKTQTGDFYF